ncbi:MAG: 4Fe-4S binding protein [Lysobacter sp.]
MTPSLSFVWRLLAVPFAASGRPARGVPLFRLLCLAVFALPLMALAGTYEAPLPAQLSNDANLCTYVPCKEVLPAAERFSPRQGRPAYVEAYRTVAGKDSLVGYVFLSTDIVDIPAYSGKPIVTLIGMDTRGILRGVKILKHSEPILLLGIPEARLTRFIDQYPGKFVGDQVEIGKSREEQGYIGLDAITGATVTVIVENQTIMRSGVAIARQRGIIKSPPKSPARFAAAGQAADWDALIREGSVQRLTVQPGEVGAEASDEPFIDLYFGYLNAPAVGEMLLGKDGYASLMSRLGPNDHAIFIVASGMESFKGSGFVRGGLFDRIQVTQGMDTFTFHDTDYLNLWGLEAKGAPVYRESGIFIIRDELFSAAYPWSLVFLANKMDKASGERSFVNFDREFWLPARYLQGGRPQVERPDPVWLRIWKARTVEIVLFVLLLAAADTVYGLRDRLVRRCTRKDKRWVEIPKYGIWLASIGFVGFYLMAQPSITHVLTWFHSLVFQWKWELFLSDPFIFIFWWFIIITAFIWGRGLFCGWLCPYGAMSEIAYKFARRAGLKRFQFKLSMRWHNRLKWVKYGIFAGLLAVSFYSMGLAEKLAEVEPFKTTFLVGVWNRSWPFVAFWGALLAVSLFTERPFCKYVCPLGAGLAIPTTFRFFGLKRKAECSSCHACAAGCGPQAIDERGVIDQRECLLCLDCQILYYDAHACPPLSRERKSREKAGLPLTLIDAKGYFIPVRDITPPKA